MRCNVCKTSKRLWRVVRASEHQLLLPSVVSVVTDFMLSSRRWGRGDGRAVRFSDGGSEQSWASVCSSDRRGCRSPDSSNIWKNVCSFQRVNIKNLFLGLWVGGARAAYVTVGHHVSQVGCMPVPGDRRKGTDFLLISRWDPWGHHKSMM